MADNQSSSENLGLCGLILKNINSVFKFYYDNVVSQFYRMIECYLET